MRRVTAKRSFERPSPRLLVGALALFLGVGLGRAQDERRVVSPDGQLEFVLFVSEPGSRCFPQLAYQVHYRGKLVVDTSFLGLNIHNQVPNLGENDGLTSSRAGEDGGYRWLVAEYMQNGSLGRRIDIEVRVWNRAVAFRYVIPRSTPLDEILIEDELTEFAVPGNDGPSSLQLPAAIRGPDGVWVGVAEVSQNGFPAMSLTRSSDGVLTASLKTGPGAPALAFEGRAPFLGPWRVIRIGEKREDVLAPAGAGQWSSARGR
jgi:hypothetical protein